MLSCNTDDPSLPENVPVHAPLSVLVLATSLPRLYLLLALVLVDLFGSTVCKYNRAQGTSFMAEVEVIHT